MTGPTKQSPVAWRCENCRKLIVASVASERILIDDVSSNWHFEGSIRSHGRYMRWLVVCPPCKRTIGG